MTVPTKILAVDDDPITLLLTKRILAGGGYKVFEGRTGREAVEMARRHHPDIVLLDVVLPDMTGIEACIEIKTAEDTRDIFIILVSGLLVSADDQAKGLDVGADGYLAKPFSRKEFLARIRSIERIKWAEEALRASELRYRKLFESSQDALMLLDGRDGQIEDVNPSFASTVGYGREELLGKSPWDTGVFADAEACRSVFTGLRRQGQVRHESLGLTTKDGRHVDAECVANTYVVGSRKVIQCSMRDITARKKAETQALVVGIGQNALLELYQMTEDPQERIAAFAAETCVRLAQSQVCFIRFIDGDEAIEYGPLWPAKAIGQSGGDVESAKFIMEDTGLLADAVQGRKPLIVNDYEDQNLSHRCRDAPEGYVRLIRFMGIPIIDKGRVVLVAGIANKTEPYIECDVSHVTVFLNGMWHFTRQRAAERAVRQSQAKYHALLEDASDAILIANAEGILVDVNKRAEELLGYSRKEFRKMHFTEIHAEDGREDMVRAFSQVRLGKPVSFTDAKVLTKDGRQVPVDITGSLISWDGKKLIQGIFRDVTERHQLEEERRKAHDELEKMVEERTAQLSQSNRLLGQQILERDAIARKLEHSQTRLKSLNARLRNTREEERAFLSREIHDGLGQLLTAIGMDIYWLSSNLPKTNRAVQSRLVSLFRLTDDAILSVQKLSAALRYLNRRNFVLTDMLKTTLQEFEKRTGVSCEFLSEPDRIRLDGDASEEILRIFQEALTNIARHSGAQKVMTFVQKMRNRFIMQVRDDGKGITRKEAGSNGALGIKSMQERASIIGGSLTVSGISQRGVVVTLTVPLGTDRQEKNRLTT